MKRLTLATATALLSLATLNAWSDDSYPQVIPEEEFITDTFPAFEEMPLDDSQIIKGTLGGLEVQITKQSDDLFLIQEIMPKTGTLPSLDDYLLDFIDTNGCVTECERHYVLDTNTLSLRIGSTEEDWQLNWWYSPNDQLVIETDILIHRDPSIVQSRVLRQIETILECNCIPKEGQDCTLDCYQGVRVEEPGQPPDYIRKEFIHKGCSPPRGCKIYIPPREERPDAPVPD